MFVNWKVHRMTEGYWGRASDRPKGYLLIQTDEVLYYVSFWPNHPECPVHAAVWA